MRRPVILAIALAALASGCGGASKPQRCLVLEGAPGSPEAAFQDYLAASEAADADRTWTLLSTKFKQLLEVGMRMLGQMAATRQAEGAAKLGLTVAEVRSLPSITLARLVISRGLARHPDHRECVTEVAREAGVVTIHTRKLRGEGRASGRYAMVLEDGVWRVDPILDL